MEALAAKPDAAAARGEHDGRLDYEIVVIGAGFSGIGAAIKLQQARLDDFVILEQAAALGGTWRDNTYPGVAVDITSLTYSFSFAQNPGWSRLFAPDDEIRRYADRCADDYGLRDHMRVNTRVRQATFDEAENLWRIESSTGTITARYIITACGGLTQPKAPDVDGLDRFEGKVMHTARWDHDYDVKGKRVAVIGTGASAVQVIPAIAPAVGRLHVFQRTPPAAAGVGPRVEGQAHAALRLRLQAPLLFQRLLSRAHEGQRRAGHPAATSTATAMRRFCGRRRHSSVGGAAVTSISIITNTAEAASRTRRAATRPDYSSGYAGSVVSRVSSMGPPRVKW